MKTAPLYRMLKTEGNKQARTLTFDGVRAEESTRREGYERLGKGKHTFIYNAHPILQWNAVEIFLYIFGHDLPINPAYRQGKARVGCVTCPFSTPWDDMVINACYADDLRPFVDKLKLYAEQVKLHGIDSFVKDRRWKLKPLANRTLVIPQVQFKGNASAIEFEAVLTDARMPLTAWLPAIGKHSLQVTADGIKGDLQYKKVIYPYEVHEKGNTTTFKLTGKLTSELTFLLRRYIYKTAYCINCEVCEVDCPTGALSILPNINIDKDKCIHCHKCFNSHDRGCVVADCTRMVNDTERKLNAKIQGYKTFGMREDWIDEFFSLGDDFWTSNSLGTAQQDSFKAWLRDAEITDIKYRLTPLGEVMKEIFGNDPTLFWEIAFINLSYNSFIVQWFCSNVAAGVVYNKKYLKEEVLNSGVAGSAATIENAAGAFVDMAKRSPIGEDLKQGTDMGKEGLCRGEHANVSLEAVAYSLYRYGKERGASLLRVSDLYSATEGHGLYKEFRISKEELHKKLRTLSSDANRVLVAELNMGLEHITLREDLTALTALKALI